MEIVVIAILIGVIYGYLSEAISEKIIELKQRKNDRVYERFLYGRGYRRIIDIILSGALLGLSFHYFNFYQGIIATVFVMLGIVVIKIDEKIRIIPNEIVLIVLSLGLIDQFITSGWSGIASGILALVLTGCIFFLSGYITKKISGTIGVGAGDIKMAMAISIYAGMDNIISFYLGIIIFLAIYVLTGLYTKTIEIGSSFPMGVQIIGGFMVVVYGEVILDFLMKIY